MNAAQTLWLLGYPEQALVRLQEALAGAHALSHPFSRAYVWCWAAVVAQFCRDVLAVHAHAEAVGMVATAHGLLRTLTPGTWGKMRAAGVVATMQGFPSGRRWGGSLHGWALAMQGQGAEAWPRSARIATMQATGAALFVPMCTLLADVAAHLGHPADGLQALTEAHTWWNTMRNAVGSGSRSPPGCGAPPAAGASAGGGRSRLQRALETARRQEAKSCRAARRHKPRPPVATAGQAGGGP